MKSFKLVLIAIFVSLFSVACTKKSAKLEYGLDIADTLRVNLQVEPPSLDWQKSTDTTSAYITMNTMEGLTEYNINDPEFNLVPALATAWEPSNKAKTWTFTVRQGVKWSDGVDFAAQHVLDGWERLLNPKTASEYAYFLFSIKNAKAYNEGKLKDFKDVGVRINDKGQIVVELEKPMSYFPMLMTHHSTYPVRKDVVEKFGDKWTEPNNIVTLGAYKLKIWEHDKAVVLERNDGYWGEKAKIKNVLGYMINEYSTAINLYDSGKLDIQETLPYRELAVLKNKPGYINVGTLGIYYYGFNTKKAPFDNPKVRRAFNLAIDRKQVTDLMGGDLSPLNGWVPKGMFGYDATRAAMFNLEEARKLLDEAGYKDRSKFPNVTLSFNTNENHQRVAENVQAQLKKNLGVDIQLNNEEWKVYLNRLKSDTPQMYRMAWIADFPDPDNFYSIMTSYSENNYTKWGTKQYDDLIAQGSSTIDKDERRKIYSAAQKILVDEDMPVAPIYSFMMHYLVSPRVENYPINAMNRYLLKGVSIKNTAGKP